MQLILQKPSQSLNKAYIRQSVTRNSIELFKSNLITCLDRIHQSEYESEEHLKNIVSDFLKDTYYKNQFEINTYGRTDLVIHNGKTHSDSVGVIIEVKKPGNRNEMVSGSNPNAKALHETIRYYMKERYENNNKNIKHIIITNIYEWFIFDGSEYEKFFFENPKLRKEFIDWNNGIYGADTTEWFYQEVAKPFIEEKLEKLNCCHFNIGDYEEIVRNDDSSDDNELIELYKILSPEHLLKKPFINDSNTLNKEFYNELLHILGLSEEKDSGKKVIIRKKEEDRNEGSMLENTISVLLSKNKHGNLKCNPEGGTIEDERMFSIALELCITWLNRILFLKLLEGQLIKYRMDKKLAFLNQTIIKDYDELNELFFDVLAVPVEERTGSAASKFADIPYLNSSLFETNDIEKSAITINELKDRFSMPIYSSTVLKDDNGERIGGNRYTLHYLFDFLNSFDFSSESSAQIQEENKSIINASVLGLIFEKINGYRDGSFFTPGFITMYMCRETIRTAVVRKFNDLKKWDCRNFEELQDKIDYSSKNEREEANAIVNSIKICDPAVGSGHFLVSALNEMIALKSDLNILCYRDGSRIRGFKFYVENDEIIIFDENENAVFNYHLNKAGKPIKELQKIQEAVFHEKQSIIENCLFGVDINPKSVLICRLRLWIELLKNAYYIDDDRCDRLETLPNIDINIKTGNSLISRFGTGDNFKVRDSVQLKAYKELVRLYKNEKVQSEKLYYKRAIAENKEKFEGHLEHKGPDETKLIELEGKLLKLSGQDEIFEDEKTIEKKNKDKLKLEKEIELQRSKIVEKNRRLAETNRFEWRFEFPEVLDDEGDFTGFDVVIGNPPYGVSLPVYFNNYINNTYESSRTQNGLKGSLDSFSLFIERGFQILKNNSYLSFIVPLSVTSSDSMGSLHKFIESNCSEISISSYSVRPQPIFDNAVVNTSIVLLKKDGISCSQILTTKMYRKNKTTDVIRMINSIKFINIINFKLKGRYPKISDEIEKSILTKIFNCSISIGDLIRSEGSPIYYRTTGGRYFKVITNYSTGSTKEKPLYFDNNIADLIGAILSSNLFFWFYQIYSNNLDLKTYEIESFRIPLNNFNENRITEIKVLYNNYLTDIEKNKNIRNTTKYKLIDSFNEYKIYKSKHLIDKIDLAIKDAYGLTEEEVKFIINYDLKFRIDEEEVK